MLVDDTSLHYSYRKNIEVNENKNQNAEEKNLVTELMKLKFSPRQIVAIKLIYEKKNQN